MVSGDADRERLEEQLAAAQVCPHLTSPHLTSPHLTSPHLTSPHLTSPHLLALVLSPWFVILACQLFQEMLLVAVENEVNIQPISAHGHLPLL